MRQHNGMRPQDVAILLKIAVSNGDILQFKDLSISLHLSASEISESLNRSRIARLIDWDKKKVFRMSFKEFLFFGLSYVFPAIPGSPSSGIATAHSHPFMKQIFISDENYVWPDADGDIRGLSIDPLYPGLIKAVRNDPEFYKAMALVDCLRVGRSREQQVAVLELEKMIDHEPPQ
jgi:hypothetical protein